MWESDLVRDGSVNRVFERLRACPRRSRSRTGRGRSTRALTGFPKSPTHLVFQRGDGTSLYITRDVAFHLARFARFARVIDVLGQDHQLHARCLNAMLEELGESRRPEFVIYQDITVPEGGRMSTRGGSAVWLDQPSPRRSTGRGRRSSLVGRTSPTPTSGRIAEAVATGAVRYHIVRAAPDKPVVFRWEDALSFEGRSGPFLQSWYARASGVLRKGEALQPPYPFDAARLGHPEEAALIRILSRFPRTVAYAARTAHVHAVAGYAHELADQFNRFYHAVPVLQVDRGAGRAGSRWWRRCGRRSGTPSTSSDDLQADVMAPSSLHASANNAGNGFARGSAGRPRASPTGGWLPPLLSREDWDVAPHSGGHF